MSQGEQKPSFRVHRIRDEPPNTSPASSSGSSGTANSREQDDFWQLSLEVLYKHRRVPALVRMESRTTRMGESTNRIRTLWLSSEADPSMFFFASFDREQQPEMIREFCNKISNVTGSESAEVDVDEDGGARLLLVGGATSSVVYLTPAPPEKHKNFLLALLAKARAERDEEVWKRKSAEGHVAALTLSLQQMERQCHRQENELELLYKLLHSSQTEQKSFFSTPEKRKVSVAVETVPGSMDTPSTSQGANEMKTPTGFKSINEEVEDMEEDDEDDDDDDDDEGGDAVDGENKPGSSSTKTPSTPEESQSQKQKSILLGIAQHILCALCPEGETLPDIQHMEQHFINNHVDAGSRECRGCPPSQMAIGDLRSHVKQHTARIYACEMCGKRGRKHSIKAHLRTHTGEKPFSCLICGRAFADSSTFKRHQLVHTGEKKYVCPICGRGIARKDNVKIHLRSHRQLDST